MDNGVLSFNDEYYIVNTIDIGCKKMLLQQDNLFIISDGVSVYDINDPLNPSLLYNFNISGTYFDLFEDYLGILTLQGESKAKVSLFKFQLRMGMSEIINIT